MDRQFFPSVEDHPKAMSERFREYCGQRKVKPVLVSSQNAALLQYHVPAKGRGFSFTVKYPKNLSRKYKDFDSACICQIILLNNFLFVLISISNSLPMVFRAHFKCKIELGENSVDD